MQQDRSHRPNRVFPNQEEMARRLALREHLRNKKLQAFKSSKLYRALNIMNVVCFFIYWELILCFFGPCRYNQVFPEHMGIKYGAKTDTRGYRFIKEINLLWYGTKSDKAIVGDFVQVFSGQTLAKQAGRDFILLKDLKVKLGDGNKSYRLNHSSPLVFLCVLLIVVTAVAYNFNLNQSPVVLQGLSTLNMCVIAAICFI